MAAKMIIGGEELEMPVWLKGRLLAQTVETTNNPDVFTCESGTSNKRYRIVTNSTVALSCSCPAVGNCCHRIAVEKYLSEQPGEMEAQAMAIIAEEKARKALANFFAFLSQYGNEQRRLYWQREGEKAANRAVWGKLESRHPAVVEAERHLAEQRKIEAFSFMR